MNAAIAKRLAQLERLHPKKIDLSLGRIARLLEKLDRPHDRLPPVVHVAGTNGKGSTIAFARAIAEAAGLRVHAYTSPHLVRFHERIRLAGRLIEDDMLAELIDEVAAANAGEPITFFEITTAIAFTAFARTPADLCLVEVGLGGRFDATNVIAQPAASVITAVGIDHQAFLGDDLVAIAREKAGIVKSGVPLIVAPQPAEVLSEVLAAARRLKAPVVLADRDFSYGSLGQKGAGGGDDLDARWYYRSAGRRRVLPRPSFLHGDHQLTNAALAIAALERIPGLALPDAAIEAAMRWARWPGRLQSIGEGPLARCLGPDDRLWLDGAHNEDGARVLARFFADRAGEEEPARTLHLIMGMGAQREPMHFLRPFRGRATSVHGVPLAGHEHIPPARIATAASGLGMTGLVAGDVMGALADLRARHAERPIEVLITGSLYLAGSVLADSGRLPD
ncbi:MAG: bifunctional folylpolyglutamate synthase/dihydrofolate synthase [Alphaproteobacteria bacterium]|nr:MAG: bifunctional folylpolyglutamate synthase/dihydrofolate synthase [Alphaproteobacteria bacterium]